MRNTAQAGLRGQRAPILSWLVASVIVVFAASGAFAREPTGLANVMILATGGTIAGSGATSTTTVGYTAATAGVDALINAVPELKKVANIKGEQVFQIASENMNNDYWLKLAKRVNSAPRSGRCRWHRHHARDRHDRGDGLLPRFGREEPQACRRHRRHAAADSDELRRPINLYNAVTLAASEDAVGKGVLVALNDEINAARDVTKANTATLARSARRN